MPTLEIRNFSCIESASISLSKLTVIIGPQASGKSIISKLTYFFYDVANFPLRRFDGDRDLAQYTSDVRANFHKWFPSSAWGDGRFDLCFSAGDIQIRIARKKPYRGPSEEFIITFSQAYRDLYASVLKQYRDAAKASHIPPDSIDMSWRILHQSQMKARQSLRKSMGADFIDYQMFIPAGRSFFTSVGKAIAVFDQGGFLDPATLQFGRYWASMRDSRHRTGYPMRRSGRDHSLMAEIFGGNLRTDRDEEYVEAKDGRRIPLTALSSGQQELLPLWMALQSTFMDPDRAALLYIEEPEAHLFPHAQAQLIQHLVSKVCASKDARRMMITTHSPYVLTKLNNLMKAGSLGYRARKPKQEAISGIVAREFWLLPGQVSAYAIIDNNVEEIIGDDGLIQGDYLDSVSSEIMSEFDALLDVEYPQTKSEN